jgi:hypothetical protein
MHFLLSVSSSDGSDGRPSGPIEAGRDVGAQARMHGSPAARSASQRLHIVLRNWREAPSRLSRVFADVSLI